MNKPILAEKIDDANGEVFHTGNDNLIAFRATSPDENIQDLDHQWLADHDAYAEALSEYRELRTEVEKAIGIKKDSKREGPVLIGEITKDLLTNLALSGLLNRFEDAVIKKSKAKDKL